MHLDLRQLRNFVALIEHSSFIQAAEAVCLSQSAFSRSIQALELSVGHPLVERKGKQPELTLHGQKLLPYARYMQELSVEITTTLQDVDDTETGEVSFGCGPAPSALLIPKAVAEFHRQTPHATVSFRVDNWFALRNALTTNELPFVVADTWHAEIDTQLKVQPLSQQRCFFVCHQHHPLARRETATIQELLSYPLAAPYLPPGIRKVLATLSKRGDYQPAIQCDHIYALLGILKNTDAISFASEDGFQLAQHSHNLVKIELGDLPDEWRFMQTRFGVISPMNAIQRPLVERLIEIIMHTDRQRQLNLLAM
ncbi:MULTISPECIES: LysR family transcriptional regulator [Yersinia]|uniref:LysR family transcriptional regulator n=1 Tax=Yersinia massiliensis TaxID=419257 RepID=A0ABM6UPQ3_9GAMM|nr:MULTISPECIES: LysR family transcriptional regulator [Yersinia]AVX36834.1 LysR family transcriptional regulator [Yersinia massiliensis]QKJ11639.1 LysR family transcriptional regulator [Yersinia massiliensis]CFR27107.1 LysR family transcriptional regulator [Yersinia frederiksenii]HEI6967144.1 LysR family transcriptional regulator [Yersinia enterocolitica]